MLVILIRSSQKLSFWLSSKPQYWSETQVTDTVHFEPTPYQQQLPITYQKPCLSIFQPTKYLLALNSL